MTRYMKRFTALVKDDKGNEFLVKDRYYSTKKRFIEDLKLEGYKTDYSKVKESHIFN